LFKENLFLGIATDRNIKSNYWRKKNKIPSHMNLDRDGYGVLWLCPVFHFDGKQIVEALPILESTVKSYWFKPNIAIICTCGRSIQMFISIMYDRS
jgi:4-cresol dehydrogenase (hydroxylating)